MSKHYFLGLLLSSGQANKLSQCLVKSDESKHILCLARFIRGHGVPGEALYVLKCVYILTYSPTYMYYIYSFLICTVK